MKKKYKDYYEKIELFFQEMKYNFDEKPLGMLICHACCGLIYWLLYGSVEGFNGPYRIHLYVITILWGVSFYFGLIYMIFALSKKTKRRQKIFALAITTVFLLFLFMWDMLIIVLASDKFYDFTEWIPLLIFIGVSSGWFVYTIFRIRKEIRGEYVKPIKVPIWLIVLVVISFAPLLTYSGRKNMGDWLPENIFLYYMSYATFLLNVVMARFILDMIMYCKISLFGRK